MPSLMRRWRVAVLAAIFMILSLHYLNSQRNDWTPRAADFIPKLPLDGKVHWSKLPERYPVQAYLKLPTQTKKIPQIQAAPPKEDAAQKEERLRRLAAVKESFVHSWEGYKAHAWLRDEVTPISGVYRDTFGGWAATLVDSLDSLWIMGLKEDFRIAVLAIEKIDFTTTDQKDINVFETTIRYMGGFLAAYDISGGQYPALLLKAVEVAELLMSCFDTPNRMPIPRWDWKKYTEGEAQEAPKRVLVSEPASLTLEFTRLSQLTGNNKYYDAVQRISNEFEKSQQSTRYPGLWPVSVDMQRLKFDDDSLFTMGGMSDSAYEYLPKQYMILGGALEQPKNMYENFVKVAKEKMFFSVLNPKNEKLKVSGDIRMKGTKEDGQPELLPRGQHLSCFTGGMVGIASRIFNKPEDLSLAEELTNGCIWAYDSNPNGIAPEIFSVIPCPQDQKECTWSEEKWYSALENIYSQNQRTSTPEDTKSRVSTIITERRLPPGFTSIDDRRYILRPEAIESVFILYRITGNRKYADAAWRMFQAIEKVSRTEVAAAAIFDITMPVGEVEKMDSMESFWLAETLKYFYLCFEEWGVVSLDDYVLNTEAHPLRRPGR